MKKSSSASIDNWDRLFSAFQGRQGFAGRGAGLGRTIAEEETLRLLYSNGGFAAKVVNLTVEEMTRKGFVVNGDPKGTITAHLAATGVMKARQAAAKWSLLFGGGIGIMLANDGTKQIWRPLREDRIQTMDGMLVFDRFHAFCRPGDTYQDDKHPKYGQPEIYTISPVTRPGSFRVHETRCVIIDGEDVPDITRIENQGWGDSFIVWVMNELMEMRQAFVSSSSIFDSFVNRVFGIPGLMKMIMEGDIDSIRERVQLMKETQETADMILLDSGSMGESAETFEKSASSVTGLPDLIDRYQGALSGVSYIPQTKLFGRSPAGLNSTGDGDQDNWFDHVEALQRDRLLAFDSRLVYVTMLAKQGPTKGKVLPDWDVTYPPLKQISRKEQAEIDNKNADTAVKLINVGVIHKNEARAALAKASFVTLDKAYDDESTRPGASKPAEGKEKEGNPEDEGEEEEGAGKGEKPVNEEEE